MNINISISDKRKLVEKLRWYTFKITYISTANYPRLYKTWYQIKAEALYFDQND